MQLLYVFVLFQCLYAMAPYSRKGFKGFKKKPGHPIILVPGDGGSQLEANLTGKPTSIHYWCSRYTKDYFDLWLNLEQFFPGVIACWADNMQLVWNNQTKMSENAPGVDIRVPGFGDTQTVEWLDPSKTSTGLYFYNIVDMLVSWGYSRGKNVIGAPYDWRRSPNELHIYYLQLKTLIETTYRWNDNTKVVILGHSMGNPVMLYFYHNYVDQEWKDKYIHSHVSLAAPWGGAMQIINLYISGYNMNYYRIILPPSYIREMQRSFTSSAFLFPHPSVWNETDVLATNGNKTYTLSNVKELFMDMGYPTGWDQYQQAAMLNGDLKAPGVPVHCAYGTKVPTPEIFKYTYFPGYPPAIINGEGDGTVNLKSALACERWQGNNNGHPVTMHEIQKAEHMGIMQNPSALELIRKVAYDEI